LSEDGFSFSSSGNRSRQYFAGRKPHHCGRTALARVLRGDDAVADKPWSTFDANLQIGAVRVGASDARNYWNE